MSQTKIRKEQLEDSIVGTTDTQTLTNKTLTSPVIRGYDGWQDANETWAYASATTITVPTGAASRYQKGDKFKLTANSIILQGYIITVADTLLTIVGDTLTNHTFTDNYYSKQENPQDFPQWFDVAATVNTSEIDDGSGGQPTITEAKFHIIGKTVYCRLYIASATKASSTAYIGTSTSNFPAFTGTTNMALGTSYIRNGSTDLFGSVYASGSSFYSLFASSIADNATLTRYTQNFSYEL